MAAEVQKAHVADARAGDAAKTRNRFFLYMSVLLLGLVLCGFGPSFFLRFLYEMPAATALVFVHGGLMTAWFVILLAQASLVTARLVDVHRRLGIVSVVVAGVAAVLSLIVTLEFGAREAARENLVGVAFVVWGNLFAFAAFVGLVSLAVYFRRQPETHKRLMLLAGILFVTPALTRIPLWWPVLSGVVTNIRGLGVLCSMLIVYDVVGRGRPHAATVVGCIVIAAVVILTFVVGPTEFAQAFVRSLG